MRLILTLLLSLLIASTYAQQINTLKGQVSSSDELQPVTEAFIEVKHRGIKILTDKDGRFTIEGVQLNDTLIISHITYESQQIIVTSFSVLRIRLEKLAKQLDEVTVSTGFQRIPKERSTGSFTLIDNKLFNEQVGVNVFERLKYVSNGVTYFPNSLRSTTDDQLLVRGLSTLTMSIQKPLIIVDNFEYQGDFNNINPNDVESITFLKDAAAGSIWGAKAANGVVVITTKKSKYNQRVRVDMTTNLTIVDKPDLFYYKSISPSDLIDLEKFLFSQTYRFGDTLSNQHLPFSPVYEILFKQRSGKISVDEADAQINALRNQDVRNDFLKYLYQKAINQQYAVNLRGGSNNIAWVLFAGVDRNLSNLDVKYNRINLRFDNTYKVTKNLELNTAVFYTESQSLSGRPAFGSIQTASGSYLPAYTKLADDNGNSLPLYTRYRQGYIDTLGGGKLLDWKYYPLEDYKHSQTKTRLRDINAVIGLNYRLFSWLNIDVKYRYEKQQTDNQTLYDIESYTARDLINNFSQINPSNGQVKYIVPKGAVFDQGYNNTTAQNIRGQVNFNRQWNIHNITAIAGTEISEVVNNGNSYRTYGYNPDILTFVNVDYTTLFPNLIFSSSRIPNRANFSKTNTRFVSFYANASYALYNKYTITGSLRRDASNLFGVDIKDKWKPLWSAGFGWNVSDEAFYRLKQIPHLKLRFTYGYQGNIDPSKVGVTTFNYLSTSIYTSTPTGQIQNFINPDLKWEQTRMTNAALDFSTKNKRISGSVEYYYKSITDLYGPSVIDPTTGLGTSTITKNVGKMKGSGFDLNITSINIDKQFKWITDFIFNAYKDKVVRYYNDSSYKPSQLVTFGIGLEGYSPFSLIVYKWAGLDPLTGDPQGYIKGQVSKDWLSITGSGSTKNDIKYIGSKLPLIFGSLGNSFRWKNISVTARITYKFKYYFLRESIVYSSLLPSLYGHSDYALRWQQPGDEKKTSVPSFVYPVISSRDAFYRNSEILVEKGDHIRFQYLNIGYEIDKNQIKKLPVDRLTLYVVVSNLGIIWRANNKGIDPDFNSLPPAKTYSAGIKVSF